MRLFIAFEIDEKSRKALRSIAAKVGGRPSRAENLHITLRFIGEQPSYRKALLALGAVSDMPQVSARVSRLGSFKDRRDALVYAAVESDPPLAQYADALSAELTRLSVPFDKKPFRPHITLARRANLYENPLPEIDSLSFTLTHATLFESKRIRGVLTYAALSRVKLGGKA